MRHLGDISRWGKGQDPSQKEPSTYGGDGTSAAGLGERVSSAHIRPRQGGSKGHYSTSKKVVRDHQNPKHGMETERVHFGPTVMLHRTKKIII